jgi:hypothetical protein
MDIFFTGIRGRLLRMILQNRQGSTADFARLLKSSYGATHRELQTLLQSGIVTAERFGNLCRFSPNQEHPSFVPLKELLRVVGSGHGSAAKQANSRQLRSRLAALGAPLSTDATAKQPLEAEKTIALAIKSSHGDAELLRVLPHVIQTNCDNLDWETLKQEASTLGERNSLGFILELTYALYRNKQMLEMAKGLRDARYKKRRYYQPHLTHYEAQLARKNSIHLAKKWNYWLNMGLDSFEAIKDKYHNEKDR